MESTVLLKDLMITACNSRQYFHHYSVPLLSHRLESMFSRIQYATRLYPNLNKAGERDLLNLPHLRQTHDHITGHNSALVSALNVCIYHNIQLQNIQLDSNKITLEIQLDFTRRCYSTGMWANMTMPASFECLLVHFTVSLSRFQTYLHFVFLYTCSLMCTEFSCTEFSCTSLRIQLLFPHICR